MSPTDRYHRQMLLPGIGAPGQARLGESHAMIVGCGALGCPVADTLARAGVGLITLIDRDVVEESNLHRQTLFCQTDADEGRAKADAGAARLRAVNPRVRVQPLVEDVTPGNVEALVRPHPRPGVIVDCTDNFQTRYLLNDAAVKLGVPLVYGAAVGTSGMALTVVPAGASAVLGMAEPTACLRCVFPDPPAEAPTCDVAGVFTPQCAIVAGVQASEALKVLLGRGDLLACSLLSMDVWHNRRQRVDLVGARRADCPCCGQGRYEFLQAAAGQWGDADEGGCRVLCARGGHPGAVHVPPPASGRGVGAPGPRIDLDAAARRLSAHGRFVVAAGGRSMSGDVPVGGGRYSLTVFADGRAIVAGTTDAALARSIYARFIGG